METLKTTAATAFGCMALKSEAVCSLIIHTLRFFTDSPCLNVARLFLKSFPKRLRIAQFASVITAMIEVFVYLCESI